MPNNEKMKVYFDGSCPICTREIGFYQRRSGADAIDWINVSEVEEADVHPGISREQALLRFHVVTPNGKILSGGNAFARLWQSLPAFRWFGWLFRIWPLTWLLDRIYDVLLVLRPRLQQWFR